MLVYGLRLLVAIITFVVGVGAGRLFGSERKPCGKRVYTYATAQAPRVVALPLQDAAPLVESTGNQYQEAGGVIGRGVINPLEIRSKPEPSYPPLARAARAAGPVAVRVLVGVDGYVKDAEAVSGHPLLQAAAVSAARQAKFEPLRLSGQPVKFSGLLLYNFVPE